MGRKRKTFFGESLINNEKSYHHYYKRFVELAVSTPEWQNLPLTCDERFLEMGLFEQGAMAFFKDDVLGYLCLPFATSGKLDTYNNPSKIRAYASNGYQNELNKGEFVIIYNNYLRSNSVCDAKFYAEKLYDLDNAIIVNAKAQKTPCLIQCDEKEKLSLLNLYQKYDGNQPFIAATKGLDVSGFKVLSTQAPYVADKLMSLKNAIWNEALTVLGIPNLTIQKKERVVTDEVQRSQGGTIASRYSRIGMRQKACEEIKSIFDIDLTCDIRDEFEKKEDDKNE